MFGKSKIFVTLALVFTLIFATSISEAGIVTDRTPIQCYVDKRVDSYNAPNGQKVGWIDPEVDLIQVLEIRPDGWARGTHPSGQRRVERWFRIADLCANPGYSNRGIRINGYRDVYRTRGSNTKFGSVSNEDVIVLAEVGNRSQILYNIKGGYKIGWIVNNNPVPPQQNTWDSKVGQQINTSGSAYTSLNPFYKAGYSGQCTWYAWGRMKEVTGKGITFNGSSKAKLWKDNATNCVQCNLQSQCIAVRIYDSGHGNGHVAFVEHVEGNNVYYSQDNWTSATNRKILKTTINDFKNKYQYFIK